MEVFGEEEIAAGIDAESGQIADACLTVILAVRREVRHSCTQEGNDAARS